MSEFYSEYYSEDSESCSDSSSDSNSSTSEEEETYDAFDQFVNGDPSKIFEWVLDGYVDKDACDEDHGESLLIWACRHHIYQLAEFLVERGCDINHIAHSDGCTALELCGQDNLFGKWLRERGAKTNEEITSEEEPMHRSEN